MRLASSLLAAVFGIVALAGVSRGDEPPAGNPVPASLLRGRTLVLEDQNCSIDAPGNGWDWLAMPSSEPTILQFQCRPPTGHGEIYLFQVSTQSCDGIDPATVETFNDNAARAREKLGDTVSAKQYAASSVPLPGNKSYRFSMKLQHPKALVEHLHGYLAVSGKLYVFLAMTPDEKDSDSFKGFVTSFRLLRPVTSFGVGKGIALGLLVMIAGLVLSSVVSRGAPVPEADPLPERPEPKRPTKKPEKK